jgi:hypothetical protein
MDGWEARQCREDIQIRDDKREMERKAEREDAEGELEVMQTIDGKRS